MLNEKQALSEGKKLLKMMKGKGWRLTTWENLGWHYSVKKGWMKVYPRDSELYNTTFDCLFGQYGGHLDWSIDNSRFYKDPNKAVDVQLRVAQRIINKYQIKINRVKE